ncbi:MAG: AAA family ATPase, partial [Microcystaceae cyanobacterium]
MSLVTALVNQKGGVGKTTIAVHLAYWLSQQGSAILVDADVQQSSSNWLDDLKLPCSVSSDPEDLLDLISELAQQYDAVVVDGPAGLTEVTKAILYSCDLALIPCKPSGLDTHSSNKIIRMLKQAQKIRGGMPKAALFLNQALKGTVLLKESRELLSQTGVPLLSTTIYNRQNISDAPGQGITVWLDSTSAAKSAAADFESLFRE